MSVSAAYISFVSFFTVVAAVIVVYTWKSVMKDEREAREQKKASDV